MRCPSFLRRPAICWGAIVPLSAAPVPSTWACRWRHCCRDGDGCARRTSAEPSESYSCRSCRRCALTRDKPSIHSLQSLLRLISAYYPFDVPRKCSTFVLGLSVYTCCNAKLLNLREAETSLSLFILHCWLIFLSVWRRQPSRYATRTSASYREGCLFLLHKLHFYLECIQKNIISLPSGGLGWASHHLLGRAGVGFSIIFSGGPGWVSLSCSCRAKARKVSRWKSASTKRKSKTTCFGSQ